MQVRRNFTLDLYTALYLPLHEIDGNKFTERSAYGHLCTVTGALWTPQGRYYDNIDDYITIASSASGSSLNITGDLTILVWVYPTSVTGDHFVVVRQNGDSIINSVYYLITSGTYLLSTYGNGVAYEGNYVIGSPGTVIINQWQMFGVVRDANYQTGYKDGNALTPQVRTETVLAQSVNTLIGCKWDFSTVFSGTIGEVWIYSRALSASEIMRLKQNTQWRYR